MLEAKRSRVFLLSSKQFSFRNGRLINHFQRAKWYSIIDIYVYIYIYICILSTQTHLKDPCRQVVERLSGFILLNF